MQNNPQAAILQEILNYILIKQNLLKIPKDKNYVTMV